MHVQCMRNYSCVMRNVTTPGSFSATKLDGRSAQMTMEATAERSGDIVRVILNRPLRLNAVSEGLYRSLLGHLRSAEADPSVRCVVVAGAGRAFCAGADLKAHQAGTRSPDKQRDYVSLGQQTCAQIQRMTTPVLAQVHGYALGAGAEIAASADFLVIAADAQMGFPEVTLGSFVGGGVTYRLPRLVGLRLATELLMLGQRFSGKQALEWGLAYAAPSAGQLDAVTNQLARRLVDNAPESVARLKAALAQDRSLDEALDAEAADLLAVMRTEQWTAGLTAFAQRRSQHPSQQ